MEFISTTLPANFNLFFFGDLHIGTLLFYHKGVLNFIESVNKPYRGCKKNVIIGMGDYIEAIDHTDRRFDVHSIDRKVLRSQEQINFFIEICQPIKDKIICLMMGNHEWTLTKYHDYAKEAAEKLNVRYGAFESVVTFNHKKKKKHMFKAFISHGAKSIRSVADNPIRRETNLLLSLQRILSEQAGGDCAIMAMGHTHRLLVCKPKKSLYLTSDGDDLQQNYTDIKQNQKYIHPDHRWYVNTGTFSRSRMKGVSGYAERAMYPPLELGYAVARVRDKKIIGVDKVFV
jgi:predicted phosphodiesterase